MAEVEPRYVMDDCIDTIRREGRASLHTAGSYDKEAHLSITEDKPRELELIMDILQYKEDRVAHDNQKYFLFREGTTSYVYLAKV